MNQITFENIPLKDITPDPNQPRKFYEEHAMDELTNSVRESGVIEPIIVRKKAKGKGYLLVCGERRYRASVAAELATIPSIIRELTDEEALQLQIIENLHRKDVHAMEEAVAFKSLHDRMTIEEIALRVGKSPQFVARRIKLTDLVEDAQTILYGNHMDLADAFTLAKLEPDAQKQILKEACPKGWEKKKDDWRINNLQYYLRSTSQEISGAIFKASDADLYPEAGACTKCQFNSANSPLLFDDKKKVCSKPSCFAIKTKRARIAAFEKIATDPDIICISPDYHLTNDEKEVLADAVKCGMKVLDKKLYDLAYQEQEPDSYETWLEENKYDYEDDDYEGEDDNAPIDEVEAKKDYEQYRADQQEDYDQYQLDVKEGRIIEAYIVAGHDAGKKRAIRLKSSAGTQAVSDATGNSGDAQLLQEISSIELKEIRNKELDAEKIYAKVQAKFATSELLIEKRNSWELTHDERIGIIMALREAGGYRYKDWLEKTFDLPDDYRLHPDALKNLDGITDFGLNHCLLMFMRERLPQNLGNPNHSHKVLAECRAIYNITKHYHNMEVSGIELEQNDNANQRIERVEKRINALRKKLTVEPAETLVKASKSKI